MSKETYSQKISESMNKKIKSIETIDFENIFSKDDNFEIALCLAYMSLSKEKIIKKDIKNQNRLSRLTQKVDTKEIDKVFKPTFSKEMPLILYARENNNLWILDNIRDSIMHGACEIDEDRKCFIINNNQYNRELVAQIPFSWFIAYAKNDILSQKLANKYTIKGYYYNKNKTNHQKLNTIQELHNNIMYRVNVYGNQFNVKEIENRVKELFDIYSKAEINIEEKPIKTKKKYGKEYLTSFTIASKKIKDIIEKEYPNITLQIYIDERKHKFINSVSKTLPKNYTNYDYMINVFNTKLISKSNSLLNYISKIIENLNIENSKLNNNNDWKENTKILHKILNNEEITQNVNLATILNEDIKILSSIYLNVYGLSTLVINHETLYNDYFLNEEPITYGIRSCLKQSYIDYANKRKTLIMQILDSQIKLFEKQEQLNKCKNEQAKSIITNNINDINTTLNENQNTLNLLKQNTNFERITKTNQVNKNKQMHLEETIEKYFNHFNNAKTKDAKRQIRKIIGKLLDQQIEEESKYTYGYCNNMKDTLTTIRNCFSHVGRINICNNIKENDQIIILSDFDSNGIKSGEVVCKYNDLINILQSPYQQQNNITKS